MTRKPRSQPEESKINPTENKQPEEIKMDPAENKQPEPATNPVTPIKKPGSFSLDKFKSKRPTSQSGVSTLLGVLPHHPLADAKDFVRLRPDEAYRSDELCFVHVPTRQERRRFAPSLILEDLARKHLPEGKIIRHRLALASKPDDVFFLAEIPSTNLDNSWNASTLEGCEIGKTRWVQLTSLKNAGQERYKIDYSLDEDAFPEPTWLTQPLAELIGGAFSPNRVITLENHPGLLRLIGAKQQLK